MAKEKEKEEVTDERTAKWLAIWAAYEKRNPEKYALKKAAGEIDRIPESFA